MDDDGWEIVPRKQTKKKKSNAGPKPTIGDTPDNKKLKEVHAHKKRVWAEEQRNLKSQLVNTDLCSWKFRYNNKEQCIGEVSETSKPLKFIGGVDISFIKNNEIDACASFVVLSFPQLQLVYENLKMVKLTEPYIPSFLAFRECPPLVALIKESLKDSRCPTPDILLVDGNGELHTRGYGAACHFGNLLSMPTIGVAKEYFWIKDLPYDKISVAEAATQKNTKKGDCMLLQGASGKIWAGALQSSSTSHDPIFVSVGHQVSLRTAISIVQFCCTNDRIPEPIRLADSGSRQYLRQQGFNKR